ncbi:hypothetical protein IV203_011524 [Nitzschia inconspicua]|uniref:Uncharacterized protein n=1 Tax=Nitzschia inconspicua TaxID=303405 RepID=A0A9K3PII3_9STRA|nr:hypothetical protein IV203_011524 [Nitzschia inconspicua]
MLDAILVNSWRAHQAVFDVAPWIATLAEPPSLAQVRRKLHCAETIEDYVRNTSMASLAELACLKRSNLAIPNLREDSPACAAFIQQFQKYKENNVWPMRRVPETSRLHGKEVSSNSSFMCRTCMVCLCKKRIGGSTAKSCYEVQAEDNTHGTDAQLQVAEKDHDEGELEEEDQEDEQEGDETDEQVVGAEETEQMYYDDVYFLADVYSLDNSSQEEEEDSE